MSDSPSALQTTPPAGLHELIRDRWSPRAFVDRPVEPEKLRLLFEAASWAASCFNEQPWRFVVAERSNPGEFGRILNLLAEKNQQWAQSAWLLGFSAGKQTFTLNGAPNRFVLHDTGAASASLAIQATALGLRTHFMGGFDAQEARTEFQVPEDFEIGAAFAVGYIDENTIKPGARSRKPVSELVFSGDWGRASALVTASR